MSTAAMTTGLRTAHAGADGQLAARLARQEPGALEELIALYQVRVMRLAHRVLGWKGDVDDVVQDVFVAAMEKARGFKGHCSLWTWLTVITLNRCRTRQRRAKLWQRIAGFISRRQPTESAPADSGALADETAYEVRAAVAALRRKDREVIVLFYLEERSAAEIAEVLGVSPNAVEVRLHRARAKLRTALQPFMRHL